MSARQEYAKAMVGGTLQVKGNPGPGGIKFYTVPRSWFFPGQRKNGWWRVAQFTRERLLAGDTSLGGWFCSTSAGVFFQCCFNRDHEFSWDSGRVMQDSWVGATCPRKPSDVPTDPILLLSNTASILGPCSVDRVDDNS